MLAQVTFADGPLSDAGISLGTLKVCLECILGAAMGLTFIQYLKSVLG
jgi:hypothetical protein